MSTEKEMEQKEFTNSLGMKSAKRNRRIAIISIVAVVLLISGGIGVYVWYNTPQYPDDFQWVDIPNKSYQMLKFEVTQAQWEEVMGENPAGSYGVGDNYPVYYVSWNDCQSFISKLNKLDSDHTYRLPTWAEWEYACRAGSDTKYSFGDDEGQLGDYAWYGSNSNHQTHPVGQKKPNAWGLYDMHGNVWEWTSIADGSGRVICGGGYLRPAYRCESSSRSSLPPDARDLNVGVRLVRSSA